MKSLKLTPEWVLSSLSHTHFCHGNGNALIVVDSSTDFWFTTLAFNTLGIEYEIYDLLMIQTHTLNLL